MVSSSPQVRYPDYYGIDMPRLEELCAFRAAMKLWKDSGQENELIDLRKECELELQKPTEDMANLVREIYKPFSAGMISKEMARMLRPEGMATPVELVFQSLEGLHEACPAHHGDWYFSGIYPTPGGVKRVTEALVNYLSCNDL